VKEPFPGESDRISVATILFSRGRFAVKRRKRAGCRCKKEKGGAGLRVAEKFARVMPPNFWTSQEAKNTAA